MKISFLLAILIQMSLVSAKAANLPTCESSSIIGVGSIDFQLWGNPVGPDDIEPLADADARQQCRGRVTRVSDYSTTSRKIGVGTGAGKYNLRVTAFYTCP